MATSAVSWLVLPFRLSKGPLGSSINWWVRHTSMALRKEKRWWIGRLVPLWIQNVMSATDQSAQISITRPQTRHDSQDESRKSDWVNEKNAEHHVKCLYYTVIRPICKCRRSTAFVYHHLKAHPSMKFHSSICYPILDSLPITDPPILCQVRPVVLELVTLMEKSARSSSCLLALWCSRNRYRIAGRHTLLCHRSRRVGRAAPHSFPRSHRSGRKRKHSKRQLV
jgi:hypothetical protein